MESADLVSLVFAVLSAFGVALANVMQRKASLEQPEGTPFGVRLLLRLLVSPTWLLGFAGLVGSFILQAVALGFGQLSTVETIITLEVPLTLLVASFVFKSRLGHEEWAGILVMISGVILMIVALNPQPGNAIGIEDWVYVFAGGSTAATILILILISRRGNVLWRTACLGAAAGTSFGLTATFIKETIEEGDRRGLVGILTTWQTYVAVTFGISGLILVQWALHTGPLVAAQPGFTIMDPIVSILWGVLVFNEMTRTGWWLVLATFGAICVGLGVMLLARSPLFQSVHDEGHPSNSATQGAGGMEPDFAS
jgi:drug/metabolite transporter (DMT)-like permease